MHKLSLLRTAAFTLLTLFMTPAIAGNSTQAQQQPAPSIKVTEADVQNFADAHEEVMKVRQQYVGKAKGMKDKKKMKQLQLSMQKDMLAAVEQSGMEPQRYNQVARKVSQDKELQQRVEQALKE